MISSIAMNANNDSPIILYIPGLYSADDPQEKAIRLIHTIYPNAEDIINVSWENQNGDNIQLDTVVSKGVEKAFNDSNPLRGLLNFALEAVGSVSVRWVNALDDVESTAAALTQIIANDLSLKQRQKLILIGHSLGSNIVIRTLANLFREKLFIRNAVLLGAAIDSRNENIKLALKATQKPICSLVNPDDAALKVFRTVTGQPPLGTGCNLYYDHSKFREYYTSNSIEHSSVF